MTTPDERRKWLEEVRGRVQRATPGPWDTFFDYQKQPMGDRCMVAATAPGHRVVAACEHGQFPSSDLEFIAHAREDIPRLLTEVERTEKLKRYARHHPRCATNRENLNGRLFMCTCGLDEVLNEP